MKGEGGQEGKRCKRVRSRKRGMYVAEAGYRRQGRVLDNDVEEMMGRKKIQGYRRKTKTTFRCILSDTRASHRH